MIELHHRSTTSPVDGTRGEAQWFERNCFFGKKKKKSVIESSRQRPFSFHPSTTHPTKPYQSPPWREKNKCLAGESAKGLIDFLPLSKVKDETVSHALKVVWEKVFSGKAHWNKLVEILLYWPWDLSSGTCLCFLTKDTHVSCRHCGVGLLWPLLLTMPESALWWERKTDCGIPLRGRSSSGSWEFQKRFSGSWKLSGPARWFSWGAPLPSEDLSSILRPMVKGENQLPPESCLVTCTHVPWHACACTHTHEWERTHTVF